MIQWLSLTFVSFRVFRKHNKLFEFYRTLAYRHSSFNGHLRSSSKTNLEQKINNSERNCSHTERPSTWRVSSNVYPSLIVILERRKHYWLISKFVSTFTGNLILAFDNEDRERESAIIFVSQINRDIHDVRSRIVSAKRSLICTTLRRCRKWAHMPTCFFVYALKNVQGTFYRLSRLLTRCRRTLDSTYSPEPRVQRNILLIHRSQTTISRNPQPFHIGVDIYLLENSIYIHLFVNAMHAYYMFTFSRRIHTLLVFITCPICIFDHTSVVYE